MVDASASNLIWTATEKCYKTPLLEFEHTRNKYNRLPVESKVFSVHVLKPHRGSVKIKVKVKVKVKVKANFTTKQATKAQKWSRRIALLSLLNLGARWGEWSTPRPGRFTPGKTPVPIV